MSNIYAEDQCTVFSIVPFLIDEYKPGLYPGHFRIEPCTNDTQPQRLSIGASEHMMYIGGQKNPVRIVTPSYQIAKALVDDFFDGQLFSEPDKKPGLCWLQGNISQEEFLTKHKDIYARIKATQKAWFILVVKKTEDDWKKYKNSRVVTDHARFAVRALGIPIPEWMETDEIGGNFTKCPACSTMNDPSNVVCSGCSVIFSPELMSAVTQEQKLKALKFAK